MFWYIVLGVATVMLIISIIAIFRTEEELWCIAILLCSIVIVLIALSAPLMIIRYKKEMTTFIETKRYIEEVAPTLSQTDNYAISNSRIEMNKWLYEIQFRYKNYHFWNFIPAEVMELEEIK